MEYINYRKEKKMSINLQNAELGKVRSVIRDIFEYGNSRRKVVGDENVFDFSLGNPATPTPYEIDDKITKLVSKGNVHGYTSAAGLPLLRKAVADSINNRFNAGVTPDNIYITCGAAASLTITLGALCEKGDNVIAFAPYFPEYKVFAESAGAEFLAVSADTDRFFINFADLENKINKNTKAVIINSPNNPSGAVLDEECIKSLCAFLTEKSKEYGHPVYIISDEPYRELVYGDTAVPYIMNYYSDCVVCYSWSKSLSLAGERIGYIAINPACEEAQDLFFAVCGAGRRLGYVCAPSLMQHVIAEHIDAVTDIEPYRKNRDSLYTALTEYGYDCVRPDGAFYLFVKAPTPDFFERAKAEDVLVVPSESFGVSGYFRISYCVSEKTILGALPKFKKLIKG